MTPAEFRAWFATLPPNYQSAARTMYDDARKTGTHRIKPCADPHAGY
jgi:hypothetical protein